MIRRLCHTHSTNKFLWYPYPIPVTDVISVILSSIDWFLCDDFFAGYSIIVPSWISIASSSRGHEHDDEHAVTTDTNLRIPARIRCGCEPVEAEDDCSLCNGLLPLSSATSMAAIPELSKDWNSSVSSMLMLSLDKCNCKERKGDTTWYWANVSKSQGSKTTRLWVVMEGDGQSFFRYCKIRAARALSLNTF